MSDLTDWQEAYRDGDIHGASEIKYILRDWALDQQAVSDLVAAVHFYFSGPPCAEAATRLEAALASFDKPDADMTAPKEQ